MPPPPPPTPTPEQGYIDKYGDDIGYALLLIAISQILILAGLFVWVKKKKVEKARMAREELEKMEAYQADGPVKCSDTVPMDGYELRPFIGSGSCGKVYGATYNGETFAVKKVQVKEVLPQAVVQGLVKEIEGLKKKRFRHPNLVWVYGCEFESPWLTILTEYVGEGSLEEMVKDAPLGEATAIPYVKGIVQGLEHLHSKNVAHGDLKGRNVLLGKDGEVKLSDFGPWGKAVAGVCGVMVGTLPWMAPEAVREEPCMKSDIWSLGCCLVEMLSGGETPWGASWNGCRLLFTIGNWTKPLPLNMPPNISKPCLSFLERCFSPIPSTRATATELIAHPFLTPRFHLSNPIPDLPNPFKPSAPSPFLSTNVFLQAPHDVL